MLSKRYKSAEDERRTSSLVLSDIMSDWRDNTWNLNDITWHIRCYTF